MPWKTLIFSVPTSEVSMPVVLAMNLATVLPELIIRVQITSIAAQLTHLRHWGGVECFIWYNLLKGLIAL